MARVIPKESTSTFIFTVIALTNFVNLSIYQPIIFEQCFIPFATDCYQ